MMVNLHSDTQTRPTPGMREVIARAEVGDEQRRLDPTTIVLEERVAALLGHETAVFLPSGTMCNVVALLVHIRAGGDEVVIDWTAHPVNHEVGGLATLAGAMTRTLDGNGGIFTADQLETAIRPAGNRYTPRSRLAWVEQTSTRPLRSRIASTHRQASA